MAKMAYEGGGYSPADPREAALFKICNDGVATTTRRAPEFRHNLSLE
jgi:hypothetical protein